MTEMRILKDALTYRTDPGKSNSWCEHVRASHLSVGTYCLSAGSVDDQMPHREDEIYVVASGRATLQVPGERIAVGQGSVIFVRAGFPHHFLDITEDLTVLVIFGPPYSGR